MLRGNLVIELALRILLFSLYVWTDLQAPFMRVIQPQEWWMYKNPYKHASQATVTTPQLFWLIIFVPSLIMILLGIWLRRPKDTVTGLLGLTMSLLLNGIITNGIKLMVGRPRPDFYERCFPDGKERFDGITPLCTGDTNVVIEGRKSFPSGHSSWSFSGLLFLSYYLAGKLQCFSSPPPKSFLNFVVSLSPSLLALFIALSRYCDYWHHYQDVVWGSVIGSVTATTSYFYYYPSLWDPHSHKPREADYLEPDFGKKPEYFIPRSASLDKLHTVKVM